AEPAAAEGTYEIALVTDVGNIDDKSFNQGAWEGVVAYAEANGKTYNYFRPSEDSDEARIETIKTAIDKGAKVVVMPGYLFSGAVTAVQGEFPEVMFLGLDLGLGDVPEPTANTALITYQEEQAGYLAGYAAVKEGYTKLGFLGGMAVPAVVRYGYGFVQGANEAAKELDKVADIQLKYWYSDSFAPSDDIKTKMSSWYTEGTEVVFACGGGIYLSAVGAAEEASAKVIGVDVDQSGESELIITSAMKELKQSVVVALTALYDNDGSWPADYSGKELKLGAAQDCVGLPTAEGSWRLANYTVDQYNELFAKVKDGSVAISNDIAAAPVVDIAVDYQN
ncbi:MAG: BMP family ABC transporter substrate-binding protein, partial [Candidatus Pelethousia sp.]|nr:BMP family ABC transporter substrate-binding protein [Candidatus Pelethousia sp.]